MKNQKITGFKAFNKDLECRGFKYEIGETYNHDGKIGICDKGFHFCELPFDVLNYYLVEGKTISEAYDLMIEYE